MFFFHYCQSIFFVGLAPVAWTPFEYSISFKFLNTISEASLVEEFEIKGCFRNLCSKKFKTKQ